MKDPPEVDFQIHYLGGCLRLLLIQADLVFLIRALSPISIILRDLMPFIKLVDVTREFAGTLYSIADHKPQEFTKNWISLLITAPQQLKPPIPLTLKPIEKKESTQLSDRMA